MACDKTRPDWSALASEMARIHYERLAVSWTVSPSPSPVGWRLSSISSVFQSRIMSTICFRHARTNAWMLYSWCTRTFLSVRKNSVVRSTSSFYFGQRRQPKIRRHSIAIWEKGEVSKNRVQRPDKMLLSSPSPPLYITADLYWYFLSKTHTRDTKMKECQPYRELEGEEKKRRRKQTK